jgi:hypothetical protein
MYRRPMHFKSIAYSETPDHFRLTFEDDGVEIIIDLAAHQLEALEAQADAYLFDRHACQVFDTDVAIATGTSNHDTPEDFPF